MTGSFDILSILGSAANNPDGNMQAQGSGLAQVDNPQIDYNTLQQLAALQAQQNQNNQVINPQMNNYNQQTNQTDNNAETMRNAYLLKQIESYNSDKYFRNPEFKDLYSAAFDALGTNLNTEMFISLLDKYVDSRIAAYDTAKSLENENDCMTDKMAFQSGVSKQKEKKLRMQDIPPEQLEQYIAKYI
ncbi:MAG: hypothetical protein LUB59_05195 [Candidatus Gastranaerophilales bacterium]|nr:hypothetical protein [Candidatus Gastranaerophilales bacterium]